MSLLTALTSVDPSDPTSTLQMLQARNAQARAGASVNPGMNGASPVPPPKPSVPDSQSTDDQHPLLSGADMANKVGGGGTTKDPANALKTLPWNKGFLDAVKQYMSADQQVQPSEQDKGMALAQAGFGMAASSSPYFGQALGQGALTGLQALQASKSSRAEMAMKMAQLQNEGDYRNQTLGIQQQNANTTQQYRADQIARDKVLDAQNAQARRDALDEAIRNHKDIADIRRDALDAKQATADALKPPSRQAGQTDEQYMADLQAWDPGVAAQAQAVASYRAPAPSTRAGKVNPIASAANELNPDLDATKYNSRNKWVSNLDSGQAGKTVASVNTLIGHLNSLNTNIDSLPTGDTSRTLNRAQTSLAQEFPDLAPETVAALSKVKTDTTAVAGETTNMLRNSNGTGAEVEQWENRWDPNRGKGDLHAGVKELTDVIATRLQTVADQNNRVMPKSKSITAWSLLGTDDNPAARQQFIRLNPEKAKKMGASADEIKEALGAPSAGSGAPERPPLSSFGGQ